jgi:putative salt-induced outer membrane protein YdiY
VACCPDPCPAPCSCDKGGPWSGYLSASLGYGEGNSDFFDLKLDGEARWERGPWAAELAATYVYGIKEGETTTDNVRVLAKGERKISDRTYVFLRTQYDHDELAGLEYRVVVTAGAGRTFVDTSSDTLKGEAGAGATFEKREGFPATQDPSAYLGLDYEHRWRGDRRITASLDWLPNLTHFDLTLTTFEVHYLSPLFSCFQLDIGLRLDHVIDPPNAESLDVLLTLGTRVEF